MPDYPHLTNPPIAEAVFDIHVRELASTERLETFVDQAKVSFPNVMPMNRKQVEISGGENLEVTGTTTAVGHILWNESQTRAVQGRLDGFTYNVVGGYEDWKSHLDDVRCMWELYSACMKPLEISRCALRYINNIEMTLGPDVATYFQGHPPLPTGLGSTMNEFFMRIAIPIADRQAIVSQALRREEKATFLVLDIDVFSNRHFESDEIWYEFEQLHNAKNKCFFQIMQPDALAVYK